jgi:hypothetical protein
MTAETNNTYPHAKKENKRKNKTVVILNNWCD